MLMQRASCFSVGRWSIDAQVRIALALAMLERS
jgi:hypothetical protein